MEQGGKCNQKSRQRQAGGQGAAEFSLDPNLASVADAANLARLLRS